ncbi:nucleoside-diphosphate-sugar epimerase family protein [Macrophomina phaseolina]|uniref:Nucleoside-diphosphate-sugar epimerase family protein n=1 Tax=Macrophomina phaseolina TaxID=35725 RepID=A0ABQ8G996_9PEZI|nr:nucleoside-diphosphate-sugar epimerase family protein [Macrophomina phaseolina]
MAKNILVTGATGKQGSALIKALLAANADSNIYALTRNTSSDSAKALSQQSPKITVIQGDLDNPTPIFQSTPAIWALFSVQTPYGPNTSPDNEEVQGKSLIDAALAAHVQHIVYSSVDRGTPRPLVPTSVPHFASKHRIEQHLRAAAAANPSLTYTILQPVAFLDNFAGAFGAPFAAMWRAYLGDATKLQLIATSDIGKVAARAFLEPEKYAGREIPLAGDDLNFADVQRIFREKTGKELPAAPEQVAKSIVEENADLKAMWTWFATDGYGADVAALREEFPDLLDYGAWVEKEGGF